jgi:hypothetical protein
MLLEKHLKTALKEHYLEFKAINQIALPWHQVEVSSHSEGLSFICGRDRQRDYVFTWGTEETGKLLEVLTEITVQICESA